MVSALFTNSECTNAFNPVLHIARFSNYDVAFIDSIISFSWPLAVAVQVDIAALATGQVAFMLASFTMAPWIAAS